MQNHLIDQINQLRACEKMYVDALADLIQLSYETDACDPDALQKTLIRSEKLAHACRILIGELKAKNGVSHHD